MALHKFPELRPPACEFSAAPKPTNVTQMMHIWILVLICINLAFSIKRVSWKSGEQRGDSEHIFDLCQCYANFPDAPPKPTGYRDCPGQALDFILMSCCLASAVLNVNSPQVPIVPSWGGDFFGRRRRLLFGQLNWILLNIHEGHIYGP